MNSRSRQRILVTGATGFIGRALVASLVEQELLSITAVTRRKEGTFANDIKQINGLDIGPETDWMEALQGVTHIIHLAGVTSSVASIGGDSVYERVNVEGTLNLARQAAKAGVTRFIFISSIGVNGEISGDPFTPFDIPAPFNAYALSKYKTENHLKMFLEGQPMELTVIRPPLVYGPDAPGKFGQLLCLLGKGKVLPLGAIRNKRSYVARANLIDLIVTCIGHPAASNETFLISDGEDLSTTELLRRSGQALGKPARLLPVPAWVLTLAATLLGKRSTARSLCGNLQIDMSHTCSTLGWKPLLTVEEALKQVAGAHQTARPVSVPEHMLEELESPKVLRLLDLLFSLAGLMVSSPLLLVLLVAGYFDTGSPLFRQQRLGRNRVLFTLIKFRTMRLETASVATHLANASAITPLGNVLRKTKLDELPQLWNVLKGEMSMVGPRPGLLNQDELTAERGKLGVFSARPGITGLAQVNKIDMSIPKLLAETDQKMLQALSVGSYFKYIFMTVTGKGGGDAINKL